MGLLDFNVGELVSRVVAGMRVRGRVPFTLDDSLVPTVAVFDATRTPYRRQEQLYRAGGVINAVAGQQSFFCVANNSQYPIVLMRVELSQRSAAIVNVLSLWENRGPGNVPFTTGEPNGTPYNTAAPTPGSALPTLPGVTLHASTTAVPVAIDLYTYFTAILGSSAGSPGLENRIVWDNLELTIPPGFGLTFAQATVNLAWGGNFLIRMPATP